MYHSTAPGFPAQLSRQEAARPSEAVRSQRSEQVAYDSVLTKRHTRWTLRDLVSFASLAAVTFSGVYLVLARMA